MEPFCRFPVNNFNLYGFVALLVLGLLAYGLSKSKEQHLRLTETLQVPHKRLDVFQKATLPF
jgi:hypothetical protein